METICEDEKKKRENAYQLIGTAIGIILIVVLGIVVFCSNCSKSDSTLKSTKMIIYSEGQELESFTYGWDKMGKIPNSLIIETDGIKGEIFLKWIMDGNTGVCELDKFIVNGEEYDEIGAQMNISGQIAMDKEGNVIMLKLYAANMTLFDVERTYEAGMLRSEQSTSVDTQKSVTIYDEKGNQIESSSYDIANKKMLYHRHFTYSYKKDGTIQWRNVKDDVSGAEYIENYIYDEKGNVIKILGGDGRLIEYKYDEEGNKIESASYGNDGVIVLRELFTYYE